MDDIIIIASNTTLRGEFDKLVEELLPTGLELHPAGKRHYLTIRKITSSDLDPAPHQFDYLGYKISIFNKHSDELTNGHPRRLVSLDIADSKVQRLKYKTMRAFIAYVASAGGVSNYFLLRDRVKALTGNYYVSDPATGIKIKTGIYFNYAHKNTMGGCNLAELDRFLRYLLFSRSSKLSKRIASSLPLSKRRELAGLSFTVGFKTARFHSFKYELLNKIKGVWR